MKNKIDENVFEASIERIKAEIAFFPDYYVSFSAGKDSGVLFELVYLAAKEMNRLPVKVVFSDLEVIFKETERYARSIMERDGVEPYWLCFEELDDNGSSVFERYFKIWDKFAKDKWVRPMPTMGYVINDQNCPDSLRKYISGRFDSWSLTNFGEWLSDKSGADRICNFIGMRAAESYGRHMAIASAKGREKRNHYTYLTKNGASRTWTSLPIYDWQFSDIWHFYAKFEFDYNRVYDSMLRLGLSEGQMRTCSAFGEEQKKSLWLWKLIEPDTWDFMVSRVEGANFGSIYNHTNINRNQIVKPSNLKWKDYLDILLGSLPPMARENFDDKFSIAFRYHKVMYEDKEGISPNVYIQDSRKDAKAMSAKTGLAIKYFISYETLCWAILKRDFVFERYGFGYSNKMIKRINGIYTKGVDG